VRGQEHQEADRTLADASGEVPQHTLEQPSAVHQGPRELEDGMKLVFGGKMAQGLGQQLYVLLKVNSVQSSQMQIHRLTVSPSPDEIRVGITLVFFLLLHGCYEGFPL